MGEGMGDDSIDEIVGGGVGGVKVRAVVVTFQWVCLRVHEACSVENKIAKDLHNTIMAASSLDGHVGAAGERVIYIRELGGVIDPTTVARTGWHRVNE